MFVFYNIVEMDGLEYHPTTNLGLLCGKTVCTFFSFNDLQHIPLKCSSFFVSAAANPDPESLDDSYHQSLTGRS